MSDDKRPKLGLVASGNFGNKPNVDKQSEDYIKLSIADAREMLDEL